MNIGQQIKIERRKLNLTQREFSLRVGIGLRFIRELEQGKKTVRLDKVKEVLDYLGLKIILVKINN